jgi:hypothetical protein
MQDIIDFLEKIGSKAFLRDASQEDMEIALNETNIEEPIRTAILNKDANRLQVLLHQLPVFGSMIPSVPDEEGEDEETGDEPEQKKVLQPSPPSSSPEA